MVRRDEDDKWTGGRGKSVSFLAAPEHGDKRWAAAVRIEPEAISHRSQ
jgi:hypothetical protein